MNALLKRQKYYVNQISKLKNYDEELVKALGGKVGEIQVSEKLGDCELSDPGCAYDVIHYGLTKKILNQYDEEILIPHGATVEVKTQVKGGQGADNCVYSLSAKWDEVDFFAIVDQVNNVENPNIYLIPHDIFRDEGHFGYKDGVRDRFTYTKDTGIGKQNTKMKKNSELLKDYLLK